MYQISFGLRRRRRRGVPLQAVDSKLMQLDLASPYYASTSANPSRRAGRSDVLSEWRKHRDLINLHRSHNIQSFEIRSRAVDTGNLEDLVNFI